MQKLSAVGHGRISDVSPIYIFSGDGIACLGQIQSNLALIDPLYIFLVACPPNAVNYEASWLRDIADLLDLLNSEKSYVPTLAPQAVEDLLNKCEELRRTREGV